MSLTRAVLRFAAPLPKLEQCERFLFVGPHPDDIEIGAGATAAKLADAGKQICFLICTDGRYGTSNAPAGISPDRLAQLRKEEAGRAASLLGVKDLRFLDLSDGGFYDRDDLKRGIAQAIGDFQPDVIFAPDPWTGSECHTDHLNVGHTVCQLACFSHNPGVMAAYGAVNAPVKALALYMTAHPNQYICTRGYLAKQMEAIADCHSSQFPRGCADQKSLSLYLKLRALDFGLRACCGQAEGFRVLGETQMHCLPEAGLKKS